ncbi:MAG: PIN domain-containing protein [Solirubrobacterales bacterium]
MRRAILDTSVLIDNPCIETGRRAAISTVSLSELYFGALVAGDPGERALRTGQLGFIEAHFDALALDERVARILGRLHAAVSDRGANPRRRTADLAIAATAIVHEATLFTRNYKDFKIVDDLVDVREPPA